MKPHTREFTAILAAALVLAALAVVSLFIGSYPLSVGEIFDILAGKLGDTMPVRVFWQLRLPRMCMGLISGLSLGVAGGVYQIIFRNPLASPDLTGVASGSSLGAACVIVLGAGGSGEIMAGAFTMGLLALGLVLFLVRAARLERTGSYILAGVVVSALAEAGLMALKIMADPERELAALEVWTMGSLASITAGKVVLPAITVLACLGLLLLFRREVLILSLGEESARSMGLDPTLWRALLLGITTLMVAAVVSVTGVISFVGLIAPHIAFLLLGRRGGPYLPLCGLVGGVVLLCADLLARSLSSGAELPLSIFTVLFAAPVLVALLCRRGDGYGSDA